MASADPNLTSRQNLLVDVRNALKVAARRGVISHVPTFDELRACRNLRVLLNSGLNSGLSAITIAQCLENEFPVSSRKR